MFITILWSYLLVNFFNIFRKSIFLLSIFIPILILITFKYLEFIFDIFKIPENIRENLNFITFIVLPAGISFYTFQAISYCTDVSRKKIKS